MLRINAVCINWNWTSDLKNITPDLYNIYCEIFVERRNFLLQGNYIDLSLRDCVSFMFAQQKKSKEQQGTLRKIS